MPHAEFVHLRTHSAYSLSEGALHVKDLVKLCQAGRMPAVAVTDTSNLFGALEFSEAAVKAGVQPIMGLLLGRMQRTGSLIWGLPFSVNLTLRQFGLVLFLAGVGTKAGDGFLPIMAAGGWKLLAAGACITAVVTMAVLVLGVRMLRAPLQAVMGLMSGIQTQPACLAYANERSSSNVPNLWYASVYPASMIAKIVLAQLLVTLLL